MNRRPRGRTRSLVLGIASALVLLTGVAEAATFSLIVLDEADEGFNDATSVAPVTGNPGTTLGEQRRNAFEAVVREWGSRLASDVEIVISGNWEDLSEDCEPDTGPLAAAGPTIVAFGFPGAPRATTWYVAAHANALAGEDLFAPPAGQAVIGARFNSAVGTEDCLEDLAWSYRIGAGPAPSGTISFVEVVLHEIAHGLGFLPLVDIETGRKFQGRNDAFMRFLEDHSRGKNWPRLTNAQRRNSASDTGDLHWVGLNTVTAGNILARGRHDESQHILMYAPEEIDSGSSASHFDTSLSANTSELMEPFSVRLEDVLLTDRAFEDLGWGVNFPAVRAIDDLNGNGGTDLAVLRIAEDPSGHKVVLLDGETGEVLREIRIGARFSALELKVIPHFDGSAADELAVLAWRARGRRIRVFVFDAGTGERLATLSFPRGFAFALEVVPSFGGSSADEVLVLGRRASGANRVWLKDAKSGRLLTTISLSNAFVPADVGVISSFGGGTAPEIALAVQNLASQTSEVRTFDAGSGALLGTLALDSGVIPRFVTGVASFGGTAADEVAIVGQGEGTGRVRVVVLDASSGALLTDRSLGSRVRPLALETVPDFGSTPAEELALLVRLTRSEKAKVFVIDASAGTNLRTFSLPKKNNPRALGVVPSLGATSASEVALIVTQTRTGDIRAIVRDAKNGRAVGNFLVP